MVLKTEMLSSELNKSKEQLEKMENEKTNLELKLSKSEDSRLSDIAEWFGK